MSPRGGTMLGLSRTVRGDSVAEFEFLRIYERGEQLIYAAEPSGQRPAEFATIATEAGALTFANPEHDFPQRVMYWSAGDSLFARIEGKRDDRELGIDFRYARVRCPGLPSP